MTSTSFAIVVCLLLRFVLWSWASPESRFRGLTSVHYLLEQSRNCAHWTVQERIVAGKPGVSGSIIPTGGHGLNGVLRCGLFRFN